MEFLKKNAVYKYKAEEKKMKLTLEAFSHTNRSDFEPKFDVKTFSQGENVARLLIWKFRSTKNMKKW